MRTHRDDHGDDQGQMSNWQQVWLMKDDRTQGQKTAKTREVSAIKLNRKYAQQNTEC